MHLRTRDELLAGRISRETAQKIWDRTMVAGQGHLALLASAAAARAEDRGSCEKITGPAANSCRQRMDALDAAVSAGRATADDWDAHIEKMKAYAAHQFGRQHAQALWVAAWTGAPKNLNAFSRAEAAVAKAPPCRPL
ncbi:hypothetical protein [Kribbella caucasensis]|nr:hypothetical protein [Kribbella sp. VKM Ac-2527]